MQLFEVGAQSGNVIEGVGPLGMARHLGNLPGGQLGVDFLGELGALLFEARDLGRNIHLGAFLDGAQFFDLGFEVGDRLLEVEETDFHGDVPIRTASL